jgi:hypothetical protein
MQLLALKTTVYLLDEWKKMRGFLNRARTSSDHRTHAAKTMLAIEKELAARQCAKPKG